MQQSSLIGRLVRLGIILLVLTASSYVVYSTLTNKKEVVASEVGSTAPDFTLKDLVGREQTLSSYKGKGVILNFWATYCPPCKKEMPYLEEAYKQYKVEGIEIIAVNVAEPTRLANQFVKTNNLTFPILLDRDQVVADVYQVINLPMTFFIDEHGEIVEKVSGELTPQKINNSIKLIKP